MKILGIEIENFKGLKNESVEFSDHTTISGRNASGKTTILDAVMWLLFNQDSHGNTKFDVRPLDTSGKQIDNIEISVKAVFDIDGKQMEIRKVQKQKWTKHRGQDQAKFEGNVNTYEVGGYPKSEKDFSAFVASIVDADVFKMLSTPTYFVGLPWKEQREVLMRFVSDISDVELANSNPDFIPLVSDIENAPTLDDIGKKYGKIVKDLKARQTEIPVRIDEVAKQKVDYDASALELQKNTLNDQIAEVSKILKGSDNKAAIDELETQLLELQFEVNDRKRILLSDYDNKRSKALDAVSEIKAKHRQVSDNIADTKAILESQRVRYQQEENERKGLGDKYKAVESEQFEGKNTFNPDDWSTPPETVCHVCGQTLPEDRIKTLLAEWDERKANAEKIANEKFEAERKAFLEDKKNRMNAIKNRGFELKDRGAELEKSIAELEEKLKAYEGELETLTSNLEGAEKTVSGLDDKPDVMLDATYKALKDKYDALEKQIDDERKSAPDMTAYASKLSDLESQLSDVEKKLADVMRNAEIDERISELESEQAVVAQKIADAERMLYLFEQFMRAKLNRVSDAVNSHFKMVKFKLFDFLINGGMKECCEVTYNGVSYSTLNSGHRIVAGLDIINAPSELYGVDTFVFIDNAETINAFNVPEMKQQTIFLKVSEDEKLTVRSWSSGQN